MERADVPDPYRIPPVYWVANIGKGPCESYDPESVGERARLALERDTAARHALMAMLLAEGMDRLVPFPDGSLCLLCEDGSVVFRTDMEGGRQLADLVRVLRPTLRKPVYCLGDELPGYLSERGCADGAC